uniref:CDC27 n=1 Tax=Heterorhabditis bacteriophora TaxID=37862 RepID=A0A1I7XEI6_HETBA
MVDTLFKYAKFMYECGNYTAASVCLYYYREFKERSESPFCLFSFFFIILLLINSL